MSGFDGFSSSVNASIQRNWDDYQASSAKFHNEMSQLQSSFFSQVDDTHKRWEEQRQREERERAANEERMRREREEEERRAREAAAAARVKPTPGFWDYCTGKQNDPMFR